MLLGAGGGRGKLTWILSMRSAFLSFEGALSPSWDSFSLRAATVSDSRFSPAILSA